MHSIAEVGTNVPAFLAKLWKLVEANEFDKLICWSENGDSFIIHNQAQFCRELLPLYYKHNNMASFVRQLNMYGFHKKVNVESGGLKVDRDEMEFAHPFFVRDQPQLLERIKRKIAETGRGGTRGPAPEAINKVLGDIKQVKGRQENLDTKLSSMKRENEALWRELAVLRQKHLKQQQIVNKLIQFLLTVVQSPNRLNVKRRVPPLMLNDKEHHHHHHHHRHHKHHQGEGSPSTSTSDTHISISAPVSPNFLGDAVKSNDGNGGPTIHELDPGQEYSMSGDRDDDVDAEEVEEDLGEESVDSQSAPPNPAKVNLSFENALNPDLLLNVSDANADQDEDAQASDATAPAQKEISDIALFNNGSNSSDDALASKWANNPIGAELDNHVEQVQNDIEYLREVLQGDSYSIDTNTLLSLFAEDPLALNMGLPTQEKEDVNAVIACNPSLFDLADDNADAAVSESNPLFPDLVADQPDLQELVMGFLIQQGAESELITPDPVMTTPIFTGPPSKKRKQ